MIRGNDANGLRWYIERRCHVSVTSVEGCLCAPKKTNWFKKTPLQNIKKIGGDAAKKGTDAHKSMELHLVGETPKDSKHEFLFTWLDQQKIKPVAVEPLLVHAKYLYGGTPDLIAERSEGLWLYDWKTGRGSTQHGHQMAAYKLMYEHVHKVKIAGMSTVYIDLKKQTIKEFPFQYIDYCTAAWLHTYQAWKAMMFRELMKPITVNGAEYIPMTLEEVKYDCYNDWRDNGIHADR